MKLIELHILQSFPVSCLNRDDVGAPKSAIFGGAQRARISSQCFKRAIRETARQVQKDAMQEETFKGSRTRKAADELARALGGLEGWDSAVARKTAEEVLHLMLSKKLPTAKKSKKSAEVAPNAESAAEDAETSTLLYFSPIEIDAMSRAIDAERRKKPDCKAEVLKDAAAKALGKGVPKDAADIAVFGRMVANAPDVTLEGAGMFSHALSTHKCDNDLDFWTAVEDEKSAGDDAGAANMGTAEFNAPCYYRYAALNLDLLFDDAHLKALLPEERKKVVDTFLRATLLAVPSARKNSMNGHTVPSFVLGIVKAKGQPIQLVNAFERPVWSKDGYVEKSWELLKKQHEGLKQTWGVETIAEVIMPDANLERFCAEIVSHV